MTDGVVVDTNALSWIFDERPNPRGDRYRDLIVDRAVVVCFQTVMELRFGALHANWGDFRRRRLERLLEAVTIVQPDDRVGVVTVCAELRHRCERLGHPLGDKIHDGDRWIAATAMHHRAALVTHDRIFAGVPGLSLLTILDL